MADYKYIMFQTTDGRCIPVIFPGTLVHADVARGMRAAALPRGAAVVSAGHIGTLHVTSTFGDSETLNVMSHPNDRDIINCHPYSNGLPDTIPNLPALMREALRRALADE